MSSIADYLVQSPVSKSQSGSNTITKDTGSPTTIGSTIVIFVSSDSPTFNGSWSVGDDGASGGNSYTKSALAYNFGTVNGVEVWTCLNATKSAQNFTGTAFGNNNLKIAVFELSSIVAIGNASANHDDSGSNGATSGSITITDPSVILWAVVAEASGIGSYTQFTGFTIEIAVNNTNPLIIDGGLASTTTNFGATLSGSPAWAGLAIAFTIGASAGISVSSPSADQNFGTTSGTGDIGITGTISGSADFVEASFNSGAYATITSSVTGSFSGTLTGQAKGTGTLTVRLKNNTSISATKTGIIVGWNGSPGTGYGTDPAANPSQQGSGTQNCWGKFDFPTKWLLNAGDEIWLGTQPRSTEIVRNSATIGVRLYLEDLTYTTPASAVSPHLHGRARRMLHLQGNSPPTAGIDGTAKAIGLYTTDQGFETTTEFIIYYNAGGLWPERVCYVHSTTGNDATGVIGDRTHPFQHIMAAVDKVYNTYGITHNVQVLLIDNGPHDANGGTANGGDTRNGPGIYIQAEIASNYATTEVYGSNSSNRFDDTKVDHVVYRNVTLTNDVTLTLGQQDVIDIAVTGDRTDDPDNTAGGGGKGWKGLAKKFILGLNRRVNYGPVFKGPTSCQCVAVDIHELTNDAWENCDEILGCSMDDVTDDPWVNYWTIINGSAGTLSLANHTDIVGSFNAVGRVEVDGLYKVTTDAPLKGQPMYIVLEAGTSLQDYYFGNIEFPFSTGNAQWRRPGDGSGDSYTITNVMFEFCTLDVVFNGQNGPAIATFAMKDSILGTTANTPTGMSCQNVLIGTDSGGWVGSGVTGITVVSGGMANIVVNPAGDSTAIYFPKSGSAAINAATAGDSLVDARGRLRATGSNATSIGAVVSIAELKSRSIVPLLLTMSGAR